MKLPRHSEIWLRAYIKDRLTTFARKPAKRVWLLFADHYEPLWNRANEDTGAGRVARWATRWPAIAAKFHDSAGRPPRYTFFYPQEEYRPRLMEPLARMASDGIADVEVHLHHDGEGQQNFVDRISGFTEALFSRHGLLRKYNGKITFGFIHGLWALDNSRPDGRYCGLNNEITLLRELGCYADFTMPSGASQTQARLINTVYWAVDDPGKPKSYDTGVPVTPGGTATGDLLMIPGPFGVRWAERLMPRIEYSELCSYDPATEYRVRRWLELAPRIGDDIFLKLFTHGTQERHSKYLLEGGMEHTLSMVTRECERASLDLHFSTAWEMRQAVDAAERGDGGFMHQPDRTVATELSNDVTEQTAGFTLQKSQIDPTRQLHQERP
ncbi:MAG: hypothetical protein WBB89_09160 [Candidatus Acidiferrum sp.]